MKIRWKIVSVVLPLLFVTIVLTGVSAAFSSTTGITRVTQDFLDFKAGELQKYAESQWGLLVENGFTNRPDMIAATQSGILSFAESLLRSESEAILAVRADGSVAMSTADWRPAPEEEGELTGIFAERNTRLLDISLAGEQRVAKGFYFAPFDWLVLVTETRESFYRDVDRIIRESTFILIAAIVVSVLFLLVLASRLTRPITVIVGSMRRIIESGDMSERVPIEYRDETGDLAHTFNIMVGELDKAYSQIKNYAFQAVLAQKRESKIRNIFQKYVPQELINRFFENPESMLVGENRDLVVLFSDIRSFTSISEQMRPDDLVNSLNRYFSVMVDLIMSRNGVIDKYIGDAIMAFFGAPVAHDDDPFQAVMAGIDMLENLDEFNRRQTESGYPEFKIGIGINFGEVTVGNIGTDKKMDYTVIGDMVNLASRLEGLTKPYRQALIFSETLFHAVDGQLPWRLLDTVAVKGKTKGVRIYTTRRTLSGKDERIWALHNEAMKRYYARDFGTAIDGFEEVLALAPDDTNARMILERCRVYRNDPPTAEWDGVEVMKSK